jgi:hypothetical protein
VVKRTYLAPFLSRSVRFSFITTRNLLNWGHRISPPAHLPTADMSNMRARRANGANVGWSCESTACGWPSAIQYAILFGLSNLTQNLLQGKDETFLCSLSNFDAYYITRKHKSPKPFVFAIKSTDNISLFENVSDYVHIVSCNQKDGERWMEAILVARVSLYTQSIKPVTHCCPSPMFFSRNDMSYSQNQGNLPRSLTTYLSLNLENSPSLRVLVSLSLVSQLPSAQQLPPSHSNLALSWPNTKEKSCYDDLCVRNIPRSCHGILYIASCNFAVTTYFCSCIQNKCIQC